MTPTNQTATLASSIIFNCESTDDSQDQVFRWFFQASGAPETGRVTFDLSESIGKGQILEMTANQPGRVYCCNLFSRPSRNFSQECSSAELFVAGKGSESVYKFAVIGCLMLVLSLILAILFAYRRYRVYLKTLKAQKTMNRVIKFFSFYFPGMFSKHDDLQM